MAPGQLKPGNWSLACSCGPACFVSSGCGLGVEDWSCVCKWFRMRTKFPPWISPFEITVRHNTCACGSAGGPVPAQKPFRPSPYSFNPQWLRPRPCDSCRIASRTGPRCVARCRSCSITSSGFATVIFTSPFAISACAGWSLPFAPSTILRTGFTKTPSARPARNASGICLILFTGCRFHFREKMRLSICGQRFCQQVFRPIIRH